MSPRNRCFSYPQGDGLFLPQGLMVFAIFCNMLMFGATDLLGYGSKNFLCVGYKIYDPNIVSLPETSSSGSSSYIDSGSYNYDYNDYSYHDENYSWGSYRPLRALASLNEVDATFQCRPLTVFNSMFWDGLSDEQEGWHAAWQAAAALGAIGTAIGAITLVVLLKSVCFTMPKKSVIVVASMQGLSALLSLVTLSAGAVDICKYIKGTGISDSLACSKAGIHLDKGSGFAIAASLFYILALIFTVIFTCKEENFRLNASNHSGEEVTHLVNSHSSKGRKNGNHHSESILPDGRHQVERSYIDENGDVVTETTIEQ